jgi:predicted Zn-dependent protease
MLRTLLLTSLLALTLAACARVEGTNRNRLLLTSASEENALGVQAYAEVKQKEKICTDAATIALVERVGRRLAAAAPNEGFTYEFVVLESPTVNAFCLPGGKVAVYTGILPWCRNEAGLAAVLGHEIGHAIARHGGERMSQGMVQQIGTQAAAAVMEAKGVTPTNQNLVLGLAGGLAQYGVILPYSRHHELEADYLGLTYMAKAGYDPHEAVAFWQRFSALSSGTPSLMSTHPASEDRAKQMSEKMPEAEKLYNAATAKYGSGELVPAAYRKVPKP